MATLVVPGYTDDTEMIKKMCGWILTNLGPDYPLHFLRFFSKYKLDRLPPTPVSTLIRLRELAMTEGVRYVYVGNIPGVSDFRRIASLMGIWLRMWKV